MGIECAKTRRWIDKDLGIVSILSLIAIPVDLHGTEL